MAITGLVQHEVFVARVISRGTCHVKLKKKHEVFVDPVKKVRVNNPSDLMS